MIHALRWVVVTVLCCAADSAPGKEQQAAQLLEAQNASDEALALRSAGKYTEAIPRGEQALKLRESVLGEHHPDVAASLNSLANLYRSQGLYARAEPLYKRSLAIREASLGKHHPDVATSLSDLADLYRRQGLFARAEPLHQRALALREAALGKHHPDVAASLNSLAIFYHKQGLYTPIEPLYQRALAIWEAALGKHHPNVATSLNNLADLYRSQGLYARAEPLYQRALAIWEASLGKHHPNVATVLNNLANLYRSQGLYAKARPLYERALAIWEASLGKHHPSVAISLNNLANLYCDQGLYAHAELLHERALAIREAALGKHHPIVATSLNNLARVHLAQHGIHEAVSLLERAFSISEQRLRQDALGFSESRLSSFLQRLRDAEERLYTLLRHHPTDASVKRLAFTTVLLRKGRSTGEIADTSRAIYRGLAAEDRDTFERLRELRTQLAQLSHSDPGPLPPADYLQRLQALADQGDMLETELAKRSAPLRALTALPRPAEIVDRVAASLPSGSALVEFVAYVDRPLVPEPGTPIMKVPSEPRYLALVLFPDAHIQALDLGPAARIDHAASKLREALARRDAAVERPAQALYSLAFQPLLPLLGDARRLFLAPDGQLGLVPFTTLHDGKDFLVDSFDFSYLNSGKDLLPRAQELPPATSVVVLADPAFGTSSATSPETSVSAPSEAQRSPALERFFSTLRYGLAQQPWTPLPGTRREAEAIRRLLPHAQLFLGPEATKQRLIRLATPGVLHVATHGFFLDEGASPRNSRGVGYFGGFGGGAPAHLPPDPLLRSGLVLSGARAAKAPDGSDTASAQAESSLVTALELAGLDLWGTQLVVLSACDTGRGDVKPGQGVYGLRRAFIVAGAETVVMSLWKVNDDSSAALMEDYYRHLLAGKGRAAALREAVHTLRQTQPHPYYWAPFIALGQDTPLRLQASTPTTLPRPIPPPLHASPEPR